MSDLWDYDPYAEEEEDPENPAFSDPTTQTPTEGVQPTETSTEIIAPPPTPIATPTGGERRPGHITVGENDEGLAGYFVEQEGGGSSFRAGTPPYVGPKPAPTTTPTAPATPAPPAQTPEEQAAEADRLAHDTDPNAENTVDYEPIVDQTTGRTTGYNMYVDGTLKETFDYSYLYDRLDQIEKPQTYGEFQNESGMEYTDPTQSAEYQGITALIAKLQDPNTIPEDMASAQEQAALALGYGSAADMEAAISSQRTGLEGGIGAQAGLTPEEIASHQEATRSTIEMQQLNWNRSLDAILSGATGNSTRNGFLRSRDFIMQIRDTQLQADMQLNNMNMQRKMEEFDAKLGMYKDLMDRGQATREQVMNAIKDNRMVALQGYATQLTTIMQKNDQALAAYSADLDRVRLASDQVYQSVQSELNIGAAQRDVIADSFNQYWAELMAPLNYQLTQQEIAENDAEAKAKPAKRALGIFAMIVGVILMATGVGAGVGAALVTAGAGATFS